VDTTLARLPPARRLSLAALSCVIFFTVCGGAFGIEALVGSVGAGWAVALILLTPLFWSLPTALMVAELASLMPEEGGYYVWVRDSLGRFWAVQEGWWTLGYSFVLIAIFPVQFVNYLAYYLPFLAQGEGGSRAWQVTLVRWLLAVLVIVSSAAVNWRGAKAVGGYAELSVVLVLGAFAWLVLVGLTREGAIRTAFEAIVRDSGHNRSGALLMGLSVVIFNYSGWDNVSTFAGEVDAAARNYPRALAMALLATVLAYLLPVLAGLGVTTDAAVWSAEAGWPVIARMIGGHWMGGILAAAGLVSMWSLFNSQLLYISRLPYVLARDGWLPSGMAKVSGDTGVPTVALGWSCAITAVFAAVSFGDLVILYVLLYTLALELQYLALIVLRVRRPDASRAFRVPGGWPGVGYVCLAPIGVAAAVLLASLQDEQSDAPQFLGVGAILLSGMVLYLARRTRTRNGDVSVL